MSDVRLGKYCDLDKEGIDLTRAVRSALRQGGHMIRDDQDLQLVREQLTRAERALASLRSEITNERNFALFSEAYVDQINELKAEIEAYEKAAKKNGKAKGKGGKRGQRKAS